MRISDWSSDGALPISIPSRPARRRFVSMHRGCEGFSHGTVIAERAIAGRARAVDAGPLEFGRTACPSRLFDSLLDHHAGAGDRRSRDLAAGAGQFPRKQRFGGDRRGGGRSEEHTSELQSLMRISYAVFCLTKKNSITIIKRPHTLYSL